MLFAVLFAIFFALNLYRVLRSQKVYEVLAKEPSESELVKNPLTGFVAMEYYWGISNRTFLIFIAPEGLYGWQVCGPVTNANRNYFQPFQEMMDDDEFTRDQQAIEKLSRLKGGFFLQPSSISSVTANARSKWGMGRIPHSGRIHLRLTSGRSREFILLGNVDPESLRNRIATTLGVGVTSNM